jgi:hypothetical protein
MRLVFEQRDVADTSEVAGGDQFYRLGHAIGKQPQAPFAVGQQYWLELHLEQSQVAAVRILLAFPFRISECACGSAIAVLRMSAAMQPMIRFNHRPNIVASFAMSGNLQATANDAPSCIMPVEVRALWRRLTRAPSP